MYCAITYLYWCCLCNYITLIWPYIVDVDKVNFFIRGCTRRLCVDVPVPPICCDHADFIQEIAIVSIYSACADQQYGCPVCIVGALPRLTSDCSHRIRALITTAEKKQPHLPRAASIKELKCRKTRVAFYREHATAKETAARRLPQSTPPTNQDNGDCCHLFVGRSSLNTAGSICTKWSSHGELSDEELQATGDFRVNQLWPAVVWEATRATRGTKCNHNCSWHDFKKADYWRVVCTVNRSTISSSAVAGVP